MSESEKDDVTSSKKTSKKKIKASTGAWWKSTVVTVDGKEPEGEKKQAKKASSSGTRKPRPKKSGASTPEAKPKTPSRKRSTSSRKKKPAGSKPQQVEGDTGPKEENPAETEAPVSVESTPESIEEKPKKPRQPRGRRGGRKKPAGKKSGELQAQKSEPESKEGGETELEQRAEGKRPAKKEEKTKIAEGPKPVTKLLINAEEPEECRLALLEDGRLESIHVTTVGRIQTKNNIYKARIVAIEPGSRGVPVGTRPLPGVPPPCPSHLLDNGQPPPESTSSSPTIIACPTPCRLRSRWRGSSRWVPAARCRWLLAARHRTS